MSFTYPGVYIEELPSPVHTIAGVPTSIAALVGYTPKGIDGRPQAIFSFQDYQRLYGGLALNSEVGYAVQQFFQNGGSQAYIVRVGTHIGINPVSAGDNFASIVDKDPSGTTLTFTALSSGAWANLQLLVDIDVDNVSLAVDPLAFNVTVTDLADGTTERFPNVTLNSTSTSFVSSVINDPDTGSQLVSVVTSLAANPTALTVTGVLGTAVNIATVTDAVTGSSASNASTLPATEDYGLTFTLAEPSSPTPASVDVVVVPKGSLVPQSLTGLASALQQAINVAIPNAGYPGASVTCTVSPLPAGTQALRISAIVPGAPDAVITLTAPTAGGDLAAALGLESPTSTNVSHFALGSKNGWEHQVAGSQGADGTLPWTADLVAGLAALNKTPFDLLSIPEATRADPTDPTALAPNLDPAAIFSSAIALCDSVRGFLLVDPPPNVASVSAAIDWISETLGITDPNGAAYWPRLRIPDPLNNYNLRTFAPSGALAGVYAKSDTAHGVWTAPAGTGATLSGVQGMTYQLSDQENGQLNPLGLNCLRKFPVYGSVVWGARTLAGADALGSQWKYVPVRRMALFVESSLYAGLQWVVFQPNDPTLWAAIRLNVGSFMQTYFRKGAFQGTTPDQAYFVKCDGDTTTPTDIDNGVVNILVGFAPLEPAEFVVIALEQLTGQATS